MNYCGNCGASPCEAGDLCESCLREMEAAHIHEEHIPRSPISVACTCDRDGDCDLHPALEPSP